MSLQAVDPRFALGAPVSRAAVIGDLDGWRAGLPEAGIEIVDPTDTGIPDLAVAPASAAAEALATGAPMLLFEGYPRTVLQRRRHVLRLIARPSIAEPALLLPLEYASPTSYAIRHWSVVDSRWKVARREVARVLATRGVWPAATSLITVAQNAPSLPTVLAAARTVGLREDVEWVLTLGKGDVLSRNVFHVFPHGADRPSWIVKFARVPNYSAPFERDERGLDLAANAGAAVAARAPRLLGRFSCDGLHGSVETAATGYRLRDILTRPASTQEKLRLVERVAAWLIDLSKTTAAPPSALAPERQRLVDDVVAHWSALGVMRDLLDALPPVPAVLQHNDVGSWNVITDGGDEFTVVDWESARPNGLPLWDLLYFLADALALLEGDTAGETRHRHTLALFRGERPASPILFRWISTAVHQLGLPASAVGPIATLCWLNHSLSPVVRQESLRAHGGEAPLHGTELMGPAWLGDPLLGASWDRWRA